MHRSNDAADAAALAEQTKQLQELQGLFSGLVRADRDAVLAFARVRAGKTAASAERASRDKRGDWED